MIQTNYFSIEVHFYNLTLNYVLGNVEEVNQFFFNFNIIHEKIVFQRTTLSNNLVRHCRIV